jgi:hypothetical protein
MPFPKVLHFMPDEKFNDFFVGMIRSHGVDDHWFLVDPSRDGAPLRHTSAGIASAILDPGRPIACQVLDLIRNSRTVVIHYMSARAQELVLALPRGPRLFWSGWGADYHHLLRGGQDALYEPCTRRLVERLELSGAAGGEARFRRIAKKLGAAPLTRPLRMLRWSKILSRVDLFSAPIRQDYDLLRQALGLRFGAGYRQVNYGSAEDTFACTSPETPEPTRVQLGNSADPVGNHLDAAAVIPPSVRRRLDLVVPLSYGRQEYARAVELGLAGLGFEQVRVFEHFMTKGEYGQALAPCGTAIFHARRQHALANVGAALWRGARTYLNPESSAFACLRSHGALVEPTDALATAFGRDETMSINDRVRLNRRALLEIWGRDAVWRNCREFVQEVAG